MDAIRLRATQSYVTTIWSSVFKRVQQLLLLAKPPAVSITGLGTFYIQKWQALEDGKTLTFQRPLFSLSEAVAQIRDLGYPRILLPDDAEKVVLNCETIRLHTPYSQQTVQDCLLETLQYFYHVLTNGEDADFTLKDIGTLAIRGDQVEMTFCEDFLLRLNKSTHVAQKLFSKGWVISDKETALLPSHFGRVHLLPEFEIKAVPQVPKNSLPKEKLLERKESFLRKLLRLRRTLSPSSLIMAEINEEEEPAGSPLPQMPGTEGRQDQATPSFAAVTSHPEADPQNLSAWIWERKQFISQLERFADIEKWLRNKSPRSNVEERVWERIKSRRADRRAEAKAAMTDSLGDSTPASSQPQKKDEIPPLCIPYPQALITLHNLLRKRKTTLVNVFKKAGMEGRNIKRADFIKIIKQTNIPISEQDLEDVIIFLTASNRGKYTTIEKLMECQKEWLERKKKESGETKRGAQTELHKAICKTATSPPSAGDKAKGMDPTKPKVKLTPLEVPPVPAEPGQGHQTDDRMRDITKPSGDRTQKTVKRPEMKKDKDSPTEWKETSQLGRSGELPVDEHCFPSTAGSDKGALVDQYRRKVAVSYLNSSKLCKERGIHLTEPVLQKGLLHPGDKIIRDGQRLRKIRQPGGYYNIGLADTSSPVSTSRSSKGAAGNLGKEAKNKMASEEFCRYYSHQRNQKEKRNKELRNDNMFWPGHLLDKLRLCIPEEETNRAHPLFSCVRPTRPTYNRV
ncbi:EF-hand calcium-binding domain-containing protein 12 isoform X2 [Numida meleagris]|uniref:EF-hand calcium-binding domain-containing protein 12 isoform X2 n=1 Tax=Numida meleagris TaxID=8996 RepID=UPI000B3D99A7|nr:EF-hand calcium-binding domain-containing protein 12 isoform X2 [Numida meleagris]